MHCLSNFHTNCHMASDMINDKAKRTNNLGPKNVIQHIHRIVGCTGSYITSISSHHLHFQKKL